MKRPITIQLEDKDRENLENVAEAAHTDATKYAATWAAELSTLKPEFALKVLGLIPPEWKHRRPGRPTGSTGADRSKVPAEVPAQDVA